MEEVRKAGHQTEETVGARKVELDSFVEKISLGGLDGKGGQEFYLDS